MSGKYAKLRKRVALPIAAIVILVLVGAGLFYWWFRPQHEEPTPRTVVGTVQVDLKCRDTSNSCREVSVSLKSYGPGAVPKYERWNGDVQANKTESVNLTAEWWTHSQECPSFELSASMAAKESKRDVSVCEGKTTFVEVSLPLAA